jgi:hypothetical protein
VVAAAARDLLPDRRLQPPQRPPLGLLPEPRRARVKGVSGAHHGEVGGLPVVSPDIAFAILAIRGHHRQAPDFPIETLLLCHYRKLNHCDSMDG